jgi:hypothetical protein
MLLARKHVLFFGKLCKGVIDSLSFVGFAGAIEGRRNQAVHGLTGARAQGEKPAGRALASLGLAKRVKDAIATLGGAAVVDGDGSSCH